MNAIVLHRQLSKNYPKSMIIIVVTRRGSGDIINQIRYIPVVFMMIILNLLICKLSYHKILKKYL